MVINISKVNEHLCRSLVEILVYFTHKFWYYALCYNDIKVYSFSVVNSLELPKKNFDI